MSCMLQGLQQVHLRHLQQLLHLQTGLAKGALVVPLSAGAGTWRQSAVFDTAALHALPSDLSIEAAATMSIKQVLLCIAPLEYECRATSLQRCWSQCTHAITIWLAALPQH